MANDKPQQPQQPKPSQASQPPTVDNAIKKLSEFLRGHLRDGESVADCVVRVVTEQGNALKSVGAERDRLSAERDRAAKAAASAADGLAAMTKRLAECEAALAATKNGGGRARTRHEPA